jgi:hypothetical protein
MANAGVTKVLVIIRAKAVTMPIILSLVYELCRFIETCITRMLIRNIDQLPTR